MPRKLSVYGGHTNKMVYCEIPKKEVYKMDLIYDWKQFENEVIRVILKNGKMFQGLLKNLHPLEMQSIPLIEKNIYGEWKEHLVRRSEITTVQKGDFDLYIRYGFFRT